MPRALAATSDMRIAARRITANASAGRRSCAVRATWGTYIRQKGEVAAVPLLGCVLRCLTAQFRSVGQFLIGSTVNHPLALPSFFFSSFARTFSRCKAGAHHRSYATSISLQEPPTRAATDDTLETEGLLACNPPEKLDPSPSGSRSYKPNTRSASKDESQVHAHGQAGTEAKAEIVTEVLPNWGGDSENHSVKLEGETRMAQDTDDSKIRLECSGGLTHQTTQRRLPPEEAENACCRTGLTNDGKAVVEPFNAIGACSLSPTVFSCRESGLDTGRCHAKVDRRTGIRATAEDGAAAEFVQGIPKPKSKPRPEPMEPSVSSFGGEGGASAGVSQEVPEMETTDHLASKYCDRRLKYDTQSKEWAREYNEYLRSSDQGSAVSLSTRPEVLTGGEAWKEGDATGQGPLIAQKPCGDWAREYHEYLCQKEDEVEASRRACATSPTADSTPGYPL